jgi:hypothetical protein
MTAVDQKATYFSSQPTNKSTSQQVNGTSNKGPAAGGEALKYIYI